MDLLAPLLTGYGIWAPVVWLVAFIAAFIVVYLLWKTGESSYRKGTELERPYLSGNAEPEKGDVHIRASNLYWGFLQALKGYYDVLVPFSACKNPQYRLLARIWTSLFSGSALPER